MRNLTLTIGLAIYTFVLGWAMRGYFQSSFLPSPSINDAPDSTITKQTGAIEVSRKFISKNSFVHFPTSERYAGDSSIKLDYSTCQTGIKYHHFLKKAVEAGANFAGHFSFSEIRTGSNSLGSFIIDLRTGKVTAGPEAGSGYQFYLGSNMSITNPPDSHGWYFPGENGSPEEYVWTGNAFRKL